MKEGWFHLDQISNEVIIMTKASNLRHISANLLLVVIGLHRSERTWVRPFFASTFLSWIGGTGCALCGYTCITAVAAEHSKARGRTREGGRPRAPLSPSPPPPPRPRHAMRASGRMGNVGKLWPDWDFRQTMRHGKPPNWQFANFYPLSATDPHQNTLWCG